jgi:hypothetical protein
MIVAIIILSILVVTLGFTTFNLLRKNEKAEDAINSYQSHINEVSEIIEFVDKRLTELDAKGHFQADDEIGFFFQRVKLLNDLLKRYKVNL